MITLNESQISDLFFNHDNVNVQRADGAGFIGLQAENEFMDALKADADEFAELLGGQVSAQWLVNDYRKRL